MPATVPFSGSREDLVRLLRRLPKVLSGAASDSWGIVQGLQLRVASVLLSKIKDDFVTKSRGGTGQDGIKWPALKRSTIAARRTTAGERRALSIGGLRQRGLLTPDQNKRWKKLFAGRLAYLMAKHGMSYAMASGRSAQFAWAMLKSEGAKTKLDVLGSRQVDILRDTGELLKSLTPGISGTPSGQIIRHGPGRVTVGTNKKAWHHLGIPGKLPARHFWPPDGKLPEAWNQAMVDALQRGIAEAIVMIVGGAP